VILLLACLLAQWPDAAAARAAGDGAYREQRYAEAEKAYEAALALGGPRGVLHYDLGACAFRGKQYARALYHFRLAQVELPRDSELRENLQSVQRKLGRGETQSFQFTRSLQAALHYFTMSELLVVGYALLGLGLLLLAVHVVARRDPMRSVLKFVVVLLVIVGVLYAVRASESARAVVLESRTIVRNEPSPQTESLFTLGEGDEVAVEEVRGEWAKVRSERGVRGWVELSRLGVVAPQDLAWS
jgi:tetratricopeptide (TPR) repeat protein